jgi:hypothetical protein
LVNIIDFFFGGEGTVLTTSFNSTDYSPLPVLHAVSAFGTRLCFYKMCRDQPIEPRFIPVRPELRFDTSTTPQERWDCDILEDEGEMRFKSVVE